MKNDEYNLSLIYDEAMRLHMEYLPHMRVGEFWWNFKMWCSLKEPDLFYVEDDQILEYMEKFCEEESEKWIRSNE